MVGNRSNFMHTWWRHQMESFSALLTICAGKSPVPGEFPTQRPVTWSFDIFFDLRLNKRLSKNSRGWWFETPSHSLWRLCNDLSSNLSYPILVIIVTAIQPRMRCTLGLGAIIQILTKHITSYVMMIFHSCINTSGCLKHLIVISSKVCLELSYWSEMRQTHQYCCWWAC